MRTKFLFLVLLAVSFSTQLFAHALWIETNATGIKGKPQEVKIYFGEFADKDISLTAKWFSDLKDFTLTVIAPDKRETKLTAVATTDYYKATFTPGENGVYTVIMHHTVKDTYDGMKIDYNSSATVMVGNQPTGNNAEVNSNIISLFSDAVVAAKQNKNMLLKAIYDGKLSEGQEIKVFAPNGWGKELYSNEKGEVSFSPLWPGKYMAEFAYTEKAEGEHNGKQYKEIWKVATYIINVQ